MTTAPVTVFDVVTGAARRLTAAVLAGILGDTPQALSATTLAASQLISANGGIASAGPNSYSGIRKDVAQFLAAAGATQGNAGAIAGSLVVFVSATASTEGVRLPAFDAVASATGDRREVYADPAVGAKVYPAAGEQIEAIATNTAQALVKAKANIYVRDKSSKRWRALVGA